MNAHGRFRKLVVDAHCVADGSDDARFLAEHKAECGDCRRLYSEFAELGRTMEVIAMKVPEEIRPVAVLDSRVRPVRRHVTVPRLGWAAAAAVFVAAVSAVSAPAIASHFVHADRVNGAGYVPNSNSPYNFTPGAVASNAISQGSASAVAERAYGFSSGLPTGVQESVQFGQFSSTLYQPRDAWLVNFTGPSLPAAPAFGVGANSSSLGVGQAPAPVQNMTVAIDAQSGQILELMRWSVASSTTSNLSSHGR